MRVLRPDDKEVGLKGVYFKGFYPKEFRTTLSDKHHILKLQPEDESRTTNGNDCYLTDDKFDVKSSGYYDLEEEYIITKEGKKLGYMTFDEKVVGDITLESISGRTYNGENKTFTPKLEFGKLEFYSLARLGDSLTEELWNSEHEVPDYSKLDEKARKKYEEMKTAERNKLL